MDIHTLQEHLNTYARRKIFFHNDEHHKEFMCSSTSYSKTQENSLCADILTFQIWKDDSKIWKVTHSGNYCAMVHASSEILCEQLNNISYKKWQEVHKEFSYLISRGKIDFTYLSDVFINLYAQPLSERRRECLILPYRILSTIALIDS